MTFGDLHYEGHTFQSTNFKNCLQQAYIRTFVYLFSFKNCLVTYIQRFIYLFMYLQLTLWRPIRSWNLLFFSIPLNSTPLEKCTFLEKMLFPRSILYWKAFSIKIGLCSKDQESLRRLSNLYTKHLEGDQS